MGTFCHTASAVPRYHITSSICWRAGSMSTNWPRSRGRKDQACCRWRKSEWASYWVSTPIFFRLELRQLDKVKSIMRQLPPKYTAGLERRSVISCKRVPRPPASINTSVLSAISIVCGVRLLSLLVVFSLIFISNPLVVFVGEKARCPCARLGSGHQRIGGVARVRNGTTIPLWANQTLRCHAWR